MNSELTQHCRPLVPINESADPKEILETVIENYTRFAECRISHDALIEAVK